jgi:uncharacterized protein YrzB (UPF0473 family)
MDKENLHDCQCGEGGCHDHDHDHDHEGCGCGCGEHEHESLIVDLEDENGNLVSCEVVDGFEYKDNEYVLVQNPNDGSMYLFKVIGEGEEGELVIPEDEEFDEVSAYYESLMEEEEE